MPSPRVIQRAHACPGRVRLRLPWLREEPSEAEPLADAIAALDESVEVEIRPWTGSVLCTFSPERLDEDRVLSTVRRHTRVAAVVRRGETSREAEAEYKRVAQAGVGSVTRKLVEAGRDLNHEVLKATDGRLDLGAVTGLGFLAVGAGEIASTRSFPAPPWFNLAWWAFRTFTIFGGEEPNGAASEPTPVVDAEEETEGASPSG